MASATSYEREFAVARLPRVIFGAGRVGEVPSIVARLGKRALVVTGSRHFAESEEGARFFAGLRAEGVVWQQLRVEGEPSAQWVDEQAAACRTDGFDVVVGVGGGSVLDAAKALAGLLRVNHSVRDFLEGVGPELPYPGPAVPWVAVPTTAGTGSEVTKNAVLGEPGVFKKSFRDEQLVATVAVVDPDLLATCPPPLVAANGMDALTQLLEAFVSLRASPLTDALARDGLSAVRAGLLRFYADAGDAAARAAMAYAALLSGICLANAGLGAVHGLASPLGAFFSIGHGVVCGTLVAAVTRANIQALEERLPDSPALPKYAEAGRILTGRGDLEERQAREALVALLEGWSEQLALPHLSALGVSEKDFPRVVAHSRGTSMRTNPVQLSDEELTTVLRARG
ncbi:MAG: iron-containing alcohol dehydrogenase [Hydrogenophilus sp.]|nr:iron-containing alcohol dehydrogenase [Hydrogenophilus sp.]